MDEAVALVVNEVVTTKFATKFVMESVMGKVVIVTFTETLELPSTDEEMFKYKFILELGVVKSTLKASHNAVAKARVTSTH